ncbi:MAG: hypothetical protein ACOX15_01740 [Tepidanaerobacteraceae bacterium]|jgi:hypothetical protein
MKMRISEESPRKNYDKKVTLSSACRDKCIPEICFCETGELLKNGGFETPSFNPNELFAGWRLHSITPNTIDFVRDTENVYKGSTAASVRTTQQAGPAVLVLRQYVDVTPGCLYRLKFAERLVAFNQTTDRVPLLIASLVYLDRVLNEYELLSIYIQKKKADAEYYLHEQTADFPVPCNVPGIIVQFSFFTTDTPGSVWNLDAVSLRAVSKASACCL